MFKQIENPHQVRYGWQTQTACDAFDEGVQAQMKADAKALKEWRWELESYFYGIDEFLDWSPEGLRDFRKMATRVVIEALDKLVEGKT